MNKWFKGALLCLIAAMAWGAMFPVANSAFKHIDPFYFTILRYGSVTIILVILLLIKEGPQAFRLEGNFASIWFLGTMAFTVYNLFIFWGQYMLGEAGIVLAAIMEALIPLFSVFIIWAISKKRPSAYTISFMLVALVGVFFVVTKGDFTSFFGLSSLVPLALLLLAVFGWAVYSIGAGEYKSWSVLRYSTLTCLYGTITAATLVVTVSFLGYIPFPTVTAMSSVIPEMSFMIIVAGVIALLAWNQGIVYLKPINAVLFINFLPVTTLAVSWFQGYMLTVYDFIGTALIIFALVSNNIFSRRNAIAKEEVEKADKICPNNRALESR